MVFVLHCSFAGVHDMTQFTKIKIIQIESYKWLKSIAPVDGTLYASLGNNR